MRIPSLNENWTAEDVINLQKLVNMLNVDSLNRAIVAEDGEIGEIGALLEDPSPKPDELLEIQESYQILRKYVDKLKPRESMVIRMRYGLDDGNFKTLEEVGQHFKVSRERIRQIEAKAIRKLKWYITVQGKYRNINDF